MLQLLRTWAAGVTHGTDSQNRPDSFLARYTIGGNNQQQDVEDGGGNKGDQPAKANASQEYVSNSPYSRIRHIATITRQPLQMKHRTCNC